MIYAEAALTSSLKVRCALAKIPAKLACFDKKYFIYLPLAYLFEQNDRC